MIDLHSHILHAIDDGATSIEVALDMARQAAEDELLVEAIAAFRARAEIARRAMGTAAYRIQRLQVNTGGGFTAQPRPMLARGAMAAEVATPQLEGGLSQIVVTVQGSIEVE